MYNISSLESALNKAQGFNMWMFVSFVLGLVAAILIFGLFLNKKADKKEEGVVKFCRDFLNFDFLSLEILLKIAYVTFTVMFILGSFGWLYLGNVQGFLTSLFIAPVLLRLAFEGIVLMLKLVRNTDEINKKLK